MALKMSRFVSAILWLTKFLYKKLENLDETIKYELNSFGNIFHKE